MNKSLFIYLTILCMGTHVVRTIYEILKHRKLIRATRISFFIIFTNMALLWISWFTLCTLDVYTIEMPYLVRILGILLVVAGLITFLTGLATMKTLEDYHGELVTNGIYSKIRHPMYLGFILWLIGMPLQFGGITSFVLCILFTANVLFWRYLEENELIDRFADYRIYREKTWF